MSKPRKREGSPYYWYDFTVGGHRYRGSTETDSLEQAKSIIAKLRADAVQGQHFAPKKETITFEVASARFLLEHAQFLKSYKTIDGHINHLLEFFKHCQDLSALSNKDIHAFVVHLRNQQDSDGTRIISDTTINRILETLRKMLNLASDKWEVAAPQIRFRQHMLREPEARTRWITAKQAEQLIDHAACHLKPVIRFALLTGVRLSNITGLRWKDVNMLHREITFRIKSNIPGGKLLVLPMADELYSLIEELRERPLYRHKNLVKDDQGKAEMYRVMPDDYVFTYKGESISDSFRKAFNNACSKSGIEDFRFHDLRHTAASWMIQAGVPIDLVQEILGHTQITTTKKYAHRDNSEKLEAMKRISLTSQLRHTNKESKAL